MPLPNGVKPLNTKKNQENEDMKRNIYSSLAAAALSLCLLAGCAQSGSEGTAAPSGSTSQTQSETHPIAETSSGAVTAAPSEQAPESSCTITFTDAAASADGAGAEIDGTAVKITESGVYKLSGSCAEGSVTVKKGVTGVTLVLEDLSLSSSEGAPLCLNKESEATVFVSGTVTLTDAEDPADEDSSDADTADAFDGAAIKLKSGATLTMEGDGILYLDGSACKNGIRGAADSTLTLASATVNIKAANKGISADGGVTIAGGALNIQAGDDAVNTATDLTLSGGVIYLSAGDDALHADGTVTLGADDGDGPELHITNCSEGIEANSVVLLSGSGDINAKDDGINATRGSSNAAVTISGGEWTVNSDGDALDSNGSIVLSGGTVVLYGAENNGNAALDYDGQFTYEGGTLLAVGMSGMAQAPGSGLSVTFGSGGMGGGFRGGMMNGAQNDSLFSITAGSTLTITDAEGSVLCTAEAVKNANSVIFASDTLAEGETYTLLIDGTQAATAEALTGTGLGGGMAGGSRGGMGGGFHGGMSGDLPDGTTGGFQPPADGERPQHGRFSGQLPPDGARPEPPQGGMGPGTEDSASDSQTSQP